ncbi:MAG: GxxExxY protein [Phycisphaerales bacterium]|nr:GxxExxY protein [Phycisphaerales bacterium]
MNTRPPRDQAMSYPDEGTGIPARWNAVTERVIGLAMEVHSILGPGLVEKLYEDALVYELSRASIPHQRQVVIRVPYKDVLLSEQRLDLVVAKGLVVELKCVERVADVHLAQLVSYLRAARMPVGLLLNFNAARLKDGVFRRVNSRADAASTVSVSPSASSATSAFNVSE